MLPTFVVALREGLEASLIVGDPAAFLIQRGERQALRPMWLRRRHRGRVCVAVAIVLQVIGESRRSRQRGGASKARSRSSPWPA